MEFIGLEMCGNGPIIQYNYTDLIDTGLSVRDAKFISLNGLPAKVSDCGSVVFTLINHPKKHTIDDRVCIQIGDSEFGILAIDVLSSEICLIDEGGCKFINSGIEEFFKCFSACKSIHTDRPIDEYGLDFDELNDAYELRGRELREAFLKIDKKAIEESILWSFRLEEIENGVL